MAGSGIMLDHAIVCPKWRKFGLGKDRKNLVFAKTSLDRRFIGILDKDGELFVLYTDHSYQAGVASALKDFLWSRSNVDDDRSFDFPFANSYLIGLDFENNIIVICIVPQAKTFEVRILTLVGTSVFEKASGQCDVTSVSLISASHSIDGTTRHVLCLMNGDVLVEVLFPTVGEPYPRRWNPIISRESGSTEKVVRFKCKSGQVFCLSENGLLHVVDASSLLPVKTVNVYEKLLLYNAVDFDCVPSRDALVFSDDSNQLHFLSLASRNVSAKVPGRPDMSKSRPRSAGVSWKQRLTAERQKHTVCESYSDGLSKHQWFFDICQARKVKCQPWMEGYTVRSLAASHESVLLVLHSQVSGETRPDLLAYYSYKEDDFQVSALPEIFCLSILDDSRFPALLVTDTAILVPMFSTTQEQLINCIIRFSGIAEAESICKFNEWNQFSIPLHTLQVGLQHRQIDTVAFFLKSRENAFTRYWKSILSTQASSGRSSVDAPTLSVSSRMSTSEAVLDTKELYDAIEMLVKAVKANSSGKHKQSFFEGLLKLSMEFLNSLLQDGIAALELKASTAPLAHPRTLSSSSIGSQSQADELAFLFDIPASMQHIANIIVKIRSYMKVILPDIKDSSVEDIDAVDGAEQSVEDLILRGTIAKAQKQLFSQSSTTGAALSDIIQLGKAAALKFLSNENVRCAERIYVNMGLNVVDELKSLLTSTFHRPLRSYLFNVLSEKKALSPEDVEDYEFVRRLEEAYPNSSFEAARDSHCFDWQTSQRMLLPVPLSTDVMESGIWKSGSIVQPQSGKHSARPLYCEVSLELVSNWNREVRRRILLDAMFIQESHGPFSSEDIPALWSFCASHNHTQSIASWLEGTLCLAEPVCSDDIIVKLDGATSYVSEYMSNILARNGFYAKQVVAKFPELLRQLRETNTLFADIHPMRRYKGKISDEERILLVRNFNQDFVDFCQKHDLKMLCWHFLEHYRVPSSTLASDNAKSWLAMMLAFRDMANETGNDKRQLSLASLYNGAYICNLSPSSVSLDKLCLDEQPVMAIATILMLSKPLDEDILSQPPFSLKLESLEWSLRPYPKLHAALFKGVNGKVAGYTSVSIYRLLQDNSPLEVSSWFGWQATNELALKEDHVLLELPHFSHQYLVKRYAQEINLTYEYYLKQSRPMFAYLVCVRDNLRLGDFDKISIKRILETTYRLAIVNFSSPSIACACIVFLDLLGLDSRPVRVDVLCADLIFNNWNRRMTSERKYTPDELRQLLLTALLKDSTLENLLEVLRMLEASVEVLIHESKVKRLSFEAVCRWRIVVQFCRVHHIDITSSYMELCAKEEDWLQFILFIHFYQVPPQQVIKVLDTFMKSSTLREHLIATVKNTKEQQVASSTSDDRKRKKKSKEGKSGEVVPKDIRAKFYSRLGTAPKKAALTHGPLTSTPDGSRPTISADALNAIQSTRRVEVNDLDEDDVLQPMRMSDDILDILLECEEHKQPWRMLIHYSVLTMHPLLPVLAACYESCPALDCLCIWYIASLELPLRLKICSHILGAEVDESECKFGMQRHIWQLDDLVIIIKFLLRESSLKYAKLLSQGYVIFMRGDFFAAFLDFIESFTNGKNRSESRKHVENFQTELSAARKKFETCSLTEDDILFREDLALQCVDLVLSLCSNSYAAHNFVTVLVDGGFGEGFAKPVPNFVLLKKTSDILYKNNIASDLKALCTRDGSAQALEVNKLYEKLLDAALFGAAKDLALLYDLDECKVVVTQMDQELCAISATAAWRNDATRDAFWKKCDETFARSGCSPRMAGQFFEKHALGDATAPKAGEQARLLLLAMRWYHVLSVADDTGDVRTLLLKLEKTVWLKQIKAEVQAQRGRSQSDVSERQGSVAATWDDAYSSEHRSRTCSMMTSMRCGTNSELLQHEQLDLLYHDSERLHLQDQEEVAAFESLIGNLLDSNQITEARRISSYFDRVTLDLDIVQSCIFIAMGVRSVETLSDSLKAILAETTSRHVSVSGILERSGSFSIPGSLASKPTSPGLCMLDWIFIEETQTALEKLTLRSKRGKKFCQRVLSAFKIAKLLCISYEDVVLEDCFANLRLLINTGFDQRLQFCRQYIKAYDLPLEEVCTFVSETVFQWIKLTCSEDATRSTPTSAVYPSLVPTLPTSTDIIQLVQLTDNPSLVGTQILSEAESIAALHEATNQAASNLLYEVELLIYAHHCFTISCNMEGIAGVLRAARACTAALNKSDLPPSAFVRLLTGIGRFREMTYIIENLYNRHFFEVLCKKGIEKEDQLKSALLDFIKKYHPDDKDSFKSILVGFGMYRENAQNFEQTGHDQIAKIKSKLKAPSKEVATALKAVSRTFSYAADNYVKDEAYRNSQRCVRLARLAELQIQFLQSGTCILGLSDEELKSFLSKHGNFFESYVVADAYEKQGFSTWIDPLFQIVVVKGDMKYLAQFVSMMPLSAAIVGEVASRYRAEKGTHNAANMKKFLLRLKDVKSKVRFARELNFHDVEQSVLEGSTGSYFQDHVLY